LNPIGRAHYRVRRSAFFPLMFLLAAVQFAPLIFGAVIH